MEGLPVDGDPDVEAVPLVAIKFGIGCLWSVPFHELALRHVVEEVGKDGQQEPVGFRDVLGHFEAYDERNLFLKLRDSECLNGRRILSHGGLEFLTGGCCPIL